MHSKNPYVALTHVTPDFTLGLPRAGPSTFSAASTSSGELDDVELPPWTVFLGKAREIFSNNTGLLLIIGSQMFHSLMTASVKKLNSVDPPVSALNVGSICPITTISS